MSKSRNTNKNQSKSKGNGKSRLGRTKFTDAEVIRAIKESAGVKSVICLRLGCSRRTLYKYLEERSQIREAYEDERETIKDMIESKIYKMIREDNPTMVIFAAKTLLKDRGFVENPNVSQHQSTIIITEDESNY